MAMTLTAYVKAEGDNAAWAAECAEQAEAMVDQFVADNGRTNTTLPAVIKARAVLEVGAELFYRKDARLGMVGLDTEAGTPLRIARDPMRAAYDLLAPYTKPAIS